jgi:cell division protein FtsW
MKSSRIKKIDKFFLIVVAILVFFGITMFISASLGILAKNETKFYGVIANQLILGLGFGLVALYFGFAINYKFLRKNALYIFLGAIVLTAMVFIPGVGMEHGGAKRWINFLGYSFQPVEFLKISFIIYLASWLSWAKNKVKDSRYSIIPLLILLGLIAVVLLLQPDTKNIILMTVTGLGMLFISGVSWKKILGLVIVMLVAFSVLVLIKPHLMKRVNTFFNPNQDISGSSYQLQQSLIAVGSGGMFGRGLGQSIQKFAYLPEPQGDSIFAVTGEELGFIGCISLLILYLLFLFRGYYIAIRAPDSFSKILIYGIITIIVAQSFMNVASIIGLFPLTGVPLVFISHGGTALLLSLFMVGLVLNVSSLSKSTINFNVDK